MKFGKQLLLHIIPEWSDKYLSYKVLKKLLSRLKKKIRGWNSFIFSIRLCLSNGVLTKYC